MLASRIDAWWRRQDPTRTSRFDLASFLFCGSTFGTLDISIISSVLLGAIPAVMVGAHFSSKSADRYIRPVLVAVLVISALGLLGVSNGWLLTTAIAAVVILIVVFARMRHNAQLDLGAAPSRARAA